jgi:ABC-type multidrug transport system fused ATPase/permease subunit
MRLWFRFFGFLEPYRKQLSISLLITTLRPLLNAAKIYLLKLIVDNLVQNPTGQIVLVICGSYLAIAGAKGIISYAETYLGSWIGGYVMVDVRDALLHRFLRLSLRYHHQHRVGEGISRLVSDIGAVEDIIVASLNEGVMQVLTIIVFLGMLFYLDPPLALLALIVLPFLFASLLFYTRKTRSASREVRVRLAEVTSTVEEILSGISLIKSFVRFDDERRRLREHGEQHRQARLNAARQRAIFFPISDIIGTVGTVLIVFFGARAVASGTLTVGGLIIFLSYLGQLYHPLLGLSRLGNTIQGGLAAAERVAALLDLPDDEDEPEHATLAWRPDIPFHVPPAVAFEHVSFGYTPDNPVIHDFSLQVPQGAIVALVGASGGGKSTSLALLQRLYEPSAGLIRVFGHDLREWNVANLRQLLSIVPQEVHLQMGSIRENIAYGRPDADEQAIITAAEQTGIMEMGLPDGLDTIVGPRGIQLSGGQRQRVALARALVRNTPILLFDEATSALDTISEERIHRLLASLRPRHTILLVAHRLSTVRNADLIAVVEQGSIVEVGTHQHLLACEGWYAALVRGQRVPDTIPEAHSFAENATLPPKIRGKGAPGF